MRICIEKSTGKIIEMQSHARLGTLIDNAVNAGYTTESVEELEMTPEEYAAAMASQAKSPEEIQQGLESAVDAFMDSKAQERGFRDRHSFALRAGIPGSSWHSQALVFGAWMDAVNDYCWQVKLDCLDGKREVPTADELLAELPVLEVG